MMTFTALDTMDEIKSLNERIYEAIQLFEQAIKDKNKDQIARFILEIDAMRAKRSALSMAITQMG